MSLSTYYLNQRISNIQAELNQLQASGLPTISNLGIVLNNGNSAGTKDINMNSQDILAVDNINLVTINGAAYPPVVAIPNLTQVLTAGNSAAAPLTLVIQDNTLQTSVTTFGTGIDIELNDGVNPAQLVGLTYNALGHSGNANGNDFTISTDEKLLLTSDNLNMSASTLGITSSTLGFTSSPALLINNTNTTAGSTNGVPSIELTKSGRNGVANDTIGSVFFNALDSVGVERTFGKIESVITTTIAPSNHDGALDFYTLINGVNQLVFRMNGADNENNSFRPLDMNGSIIKTSVGDLSIDAGVSLNNGIISLKPKSNSGFINIPSQGDPTLDFIKIQPSTGVGQSINMNATENSTGFKHSINLSNTANTPSIQVLANDGGVTNQASITMTSNITTAINSIVSSGGGLGSDLVIQSTNTTNDGSIEFQPDSTGGDLIFTGANIQSSSASGNSGSHLRIKLNGTYYKIKLEND